MADLPTRDEFLATGVASCAAAEGSECPICREPYPPGVSAANDKKPAELPSATRDAAGLTSGQSSADDSKRVPSRVPCCNNVFCRECLDAWLRTANTCPLCRAELYDAAELSDDDDDDEDDEPATDVQQPDANEQDPESSDDEDPFIYSRYQDNFRSDS